MKHGNWRRFKYPRWLLATAACACCGLPSPTYAQSSEGAVSGTQPSPPADIVVTAQRRVQSVQKVPIAITVLQGATIAKSQFTQLQDLKFLAPSLQFQPAGNQGNSSFSIRGIGTSTFDDAVEKSVGVMLDDVPQLLPRSSFLNMLVDVDRIEILRGPQGTLLGKNTTGGLITIVTRKPEPGVYSDDGHIEYGTDNAIRAYDVVNVPLASNLTARIKVGYQFRNSYVRSTVFGTEPPSRDIVANAKLLWTPTDRLSVYLIGDYQKTSDDSSPNVSRGFADLKNPANFVSAIEASLGIVPGPKNRTLAANTPAFEHIMSYGGQVTTNLDVNGGTLTSITAYRHQSYSQNLEGDSTPERIFDYNIDRTISRQFTQEVRYASPTGGLVDYVFGGFYSSFTPRLTDLQGGTLGLEPNDSPTLLLLQGGLQNRSVSAHSLAGFGQGTLHATDRLRFTLGARVTRDSTKSHYIVTAYPAGCQAAFAFGAPCLAANVGVPLGGGVKHTDWSGRAGIEYDLAPDKLVYASVSRGYKGASVTTTSGIVSFLKPETVWDYEVGIKTAFFDRRLTVNLAGFYSKFKDFQAQALDVSGTGVGVFDYTNAGALRTQGVEMDLNANLVRDLTLSAGLTYLDAKYLNYRPACYPAIEGTASCAADGTFNAAGLALPNAPKWTATLGGSYSTRVSDSYVVSATANYAYRSAALFQVGDPGTRQPGYGIVNASISLGTPDNSVMLTLFARNLFNKNFVANIGPSFFEASYRQNPTFLATRTVGISLDWKLRN